ncbi:Nif3-like dinuclear metal center hexameric protein [Paratissierella segnis]|uniref:GTP cyclohydrolase 1 type 2 homolog n=1 Tax=Paratissierella segnis TaxID=2763679 RepID=A0A926ERF7_9FIRM|nr:Nif3-like dinuclear metal center hexameric protein [Paratissierella segnis]MBC8588363.1 Nif3-like dinuclear metal center hexameric protein [Paratissierella segnis]
MKAKDIINAMDSWADSKLIDSWDNTGFQVGCDDSHIERILVALDTNEDVLNTAIKENYQMIITHHPIIFKPLNSITNRTYKERLILSAIREDITIYNAHSNLDLAIGGVNDILADMLELKNATCLSISKIYDDKIYGYGRIGDIEKRTAIEYLGLVKSKLDVDYISVFGDINKSISRVAVCGGSGSDFIYDAYKMGADIYITGDIKYHDAEMAVQLGLLLADAGHYHTEKIILSEIKKYLDERFHNEIYIKIYEEPSVKCQLY